MEDLKIIDKVDISKFAKKPHKPHIINAKKPIERQQVSVSFFIGKNGQVIGRLSSGKIAIISKGVRTNLINENEEWIVEIIKEEDHRAIVMPLYLIKSAEDKSNKNWNHE